MLPKNIAACVDTEVNDSLKKINPETHLCEGGIQGVSVKSGVVLHNYTL